MITSTARAPYKAEMRGINSLAENACFRNVLPYVFADEQNGYSPEQNRDLVT